jgi:hypothetical protein
MSNILNVEICDVCGVVNYANGNQLVFWMEDIPKNPTVKDIKEFSGKISNDYPTIERVARELIQYYSQWVPAEIINV